MGGDIVLSTLRARYKCFPVCNGRSRIPVDFKLEVVETWLGRYHRTMSKAAFCGHIGIADSLFYRWLGLYAEPEQPTVSANKVINDKIADLKRQISKLEAERDAINSLTAKGYKVYK